LRPIVEIGLFVVAEVLQRAALEIERAWIAVAAREAFDARLHRGSGVVTVEAEPRHVVDDAETDAVRIAVDLFRGFAKLRLVDPVESELDAALLARERELLLHVVGLALPVLLLFERVGAGTGGAGEKKRRGEQFVHANHSFRADRRRRRAKRRSRRSACRSSDRGRRPSDGRRPTTAASC